MKNLKDIVARWLDNFLSFPEKGCRCKQHGYKGWLFIKSQPCSSHFNLSWPHGEPCEICGWAKT